MYFLIRKIFGLLLCLAVFFPVMAVAGPGRTGAQILNLGGGARARSRAGRDGVLPGCVSRLPALSAPRPARSGRRRHPGAHRAAASHRDSSQLTSGAERERIHARGVSSRGAGVPLAAVPAPGPTTRCECRRSCAPARVAGGDSAGGDRNRRCATSGHRAALVAGGDRLKFRSRFAVDVRRGTAPPPRAPSRRAEAFRPGPPAATRRTSRRQSGRRS